MNAAIDKVPVSRYNSAIVKNADNPASKNDPTGREEQASALKIPLILPTNSSGIRLTKITWTVTPIMEFKTPNTKAAAK